MKYNLVLALFLAASHFTGEISGNIDAYKYKGDKEYKPVIKKFSDYYKIYI